MPCQALRQSDQMYCARCDLRWDADDPAPPKCKEDTNAPAHRKQTKRK